MTELLPEILKLGAVGVAIIVAGMILWFGFKILLPIAMAVRPSDGRGPDSAGPLYLALQQIATLPSEIKALNATITELLNHVWTKDEVMEEMRKNRHDVADIVAAPIAELSLEVQQLQVPRRSDRRAKERRKKK